MQVKVSVGAAWLDAVPVCALGVDFRACIPLDERKLNISKK
jgi:hypothetical protein